MAITAVVRAHSLYIVVDNELRFLWSGFLGIYSEPKAGCQN